MTVTVKTINKFKWHTLFNESKEIILKNQQKCLNEVNITKNRLELDKHKNQ